MSRSKYIYLVWDCVGMEFEVPIAVFTVKHEMISFIKRRKIKLMNLIINRYPDGTESTVENVYDYTLVEMKEMLQ